MSHSPSSLNASVRAELAALEAEIAEYNRFPHARSVRMSDIKAKPLSFLWRPFLPLGKVSLLVGDPGLGKSLLTATIAAHVSTGRAWPVGDSACQKGSVLLLSAEDDAADTIRPRLEAAQADLTRIRELQGVVRPDPNTGDQRECMFSLAHDIVSLDELLGEMKECRLVVIDPISAYLGGKDSHKNSDIREVLAPVTSLAQKHNVAIICVSHLSKSSGPAAYRTIGSIAFTATARAVFAIARDPNDEMRRLFMPVKSNLAPDMLGFAYHIATATTVVGEHPVIQFESVPIHESADDVLGAAWNNPDGRSEIDEATDWLESYLGNEPRSAKQIQRDSRDAGLSWRTLRRAKEKLGIKTEKIGFDGGWVWGLPPKVSSAPEDVQSHNVDTLASVGHLAEKSATHDGMLNEIAQASGISIADLQIEAGEDWAELSGSPDQLRSFADALACTRMRKLGQVPPSYTAVTTCKLCGLVPIFPGCGTNVSNCTWCFNRVRGLPIPRPNTVALLNDRNRT